MAQRHAPEAIVGNGRNCAGELRGCSHGMEQSGDENRRTQRQHRTSLRRSGNGVPRKQAATDARVRGAHDRRTRVDGDRLPWPVAIRFDTCKCTANLGDAHSGVALEQ